LYFMSDSICDVSNVSVCGNKRMDLKITKMKVKTK
jgi:hypothetical protein